MQLYRQPNQIIQQINRETKRETHQARARAGRNTAIVGGALLALGLLAATAGMNKNYKGHSKRMGCYTEIVLSSTLIAQGLIKYRRNKRELNFN
jgi:hypothetical protein